jgi:lysozyme family protein
MIDLIALKASNLKRWEAARINPPLIHFINSVARRLVESKARYQEVWNNTGVPWSVIAVIHERESSQSWTASLAQGDPWNRISIHVPRGRGPFNSWEEAAQDALVICPPHAAAWKDWTIGGALTLLEQYNGLGYAAHGMPSPYIWASTNQYIKGKYTADGHLDPDAVDHQLGCAALLAAIIAIDPSVKFEGQQ